MIIAIELSASYFVPYRRNIGSRNNQSQADERPLGKQYIFLKAGEADVQDADVPSKNHQDET